MMMMIISIKVQILKFLKKLKMNNLILLFIQLLIFLKWLIKKYKHQLFKRISHKMENRKNQKKKKF